MTASTASGSSANSSARAAAYDTAPVSLASSLTRVVGWWSSLSATRVKELVNEAGAVSYAAALAELFALDPEAVDAVTRPEGLH